MGGRTDGRTDRGGLWPFIPGRSGFCFRLVRPGEADRAGACTPGCSLWGPRLGSLQCPREPPSFVSQPRPRPWHAQALPAHLLGLRAGPGHVLRSASASELRSGHLGRGRLRMIPPLSTVPRALHSGPARPPALVAPNPTSPSRSRGTATAFDHWLPGGLWLGRNCADR